MPDEYCEVFEPMCMKAPKTNYYDIRAIFNQEMGFTIEDIFSEFDNEPLASASLG